MPINIISEIVGKGNNSFALLDDTAIRGGFRIVSNLTERNDIPSDKRKAGMKVSVQSTDVIYTLNDDLISWSVDNTLTQSLQAAYNGGATITVIDGTPVIIRSPGANPTSLFEIQDHLLNPIFKIDNQSKVEFYKQLKGKEYTSSVETVAATNSQDVFIDKFDKSLYRAVQYFYTVSNSDNSGYETGQIFVVHNGLGVVIEWIMGSAIGTPCGITFHADMIAYDINLRANTDNSGSFSRVINLFKIALV